MRPGKIVCVGRNYAAHAAELGNELPDFPLIFLKPASALIKTGESVIHPGYSNDLHYEAELVLKIGTTIKNANKEEAEAAISAYTVGLDMTLRDIQDTLKKKGHPWTLAKCFDTSAVISDFISSKEYKLTLDEKIKLTVNDEVRQDSELSLMIFKPADIVEFISSRLTLEEGDLIFTGTPAGVGKVNPGDKIFASIDNIAELETTVK